MVVKLIVLSCLVAAVAAVAVPQDAVAVQGPVATKLIYQEQETPAQYEYEYSIQDPQSGDDKSAKENRNGDDVQGYYSFVQPDGVRRIVEYSSSKEHGFNAVVRYEGTPVATKVVAQAPVAYAAAPVAKVAYAPAPAQVAYAQSPAPVAYAQPVAYAPAPVQKVAYAPAPVAYAPQPVAYAPAPVQRIAYAPAPTQVTYAQASQPQYAYAQAPVVHAQPVAKVAYPSAQVAYAQAPAQVAYAQAPVTYAQQVGQITYSPAASVGHFSFASPVVSYKH
ncbi:insect cuticle protein domain-containing protein [Phthorimaea operculella]|nr:insect cuticle protein domain-containing protein [Phthorimaea operculella]